MLTTAEARFARLFLRQSGAQAGAIDLALQQAPTLLAQGGAQQYGPPAPSNVGASPAPVVTQKPPSGPSAQAPIEATPPQSGLSTTAKVAIGVAAFGVVYFFVKRRS